MMTHKEIIQNMFYLTRNDSVEITTDEELFSYANNWVVSNNVNTPGIDEFERNQTDRLFLILCCELHFYTFLYRDDETVPRFRSLYCWKDGDKYKVRIELSSENIEGDLLEIYSLIHEHNKELRAREARKKP